MAQKKTPITQILKSIKNLRPLRRFCGICVPQCLTCSLLGALFDALFGPNTYAYWLRLAWLQITFMQLLLYPSVGVLSGWRLAKRLPYRTNYPLCLCA